ncbi:hypothetical protein ABE142_02070 [Paenibacillus alvei]|uniref:hypothetical protein n=1 Tax=Paenibacillus alvei TaxID=44250 RepID=UPI003D2B7649
MAFEKELPEWKEKGVKPPQSKLDEGWKVQDKPPAAWLNWQMNKTYEALKEVQEKAAEMTDVTKTLKDAKDYTDQKVKDIDLSKITPESIGALPIAGGTVRGNLGVQGPNGVLQFQSGTGDNATYETYNNAMQAHWGLAMKTYDSTVTGLWDSRMGRWVTKGGYVVQNNNGVQWSVDTNGEQSMNGNLYANKQIHAAGRVWVGKTTQFGNEASCTLTLGDTDTGLNWVGDGEFDIMSNAQAAAKVYGGQMSFRMADGSYKTAQELFQSGVNAKQGTVDVLNSKSVAASTNDTWPTLHAKIGTLANNNRSSHDWANTNIDGNFTYTVYTFIGTKFAVFNDAGNYYERSQVNIPWVGSFWARNGVRLVDANGKTCTILQLTESTSTVQLYIQSFTINFTSNVYYVNCTRRKPAATGNDEMESWTRSGAIDLDTTRPIQLEYYTETNGATGLYQRFIGNMEDFK